MDVDGSYLYRKQQTVTQSGISGLAAKFLCVSMVVNGNETVNCSFLQEYTVSATLTNGASR